MEALLASVGITATLLPPTTARVRGELKTRYSDFLVNEVAPGGGVVRLARLWPHDLPEPPRSAEAEAPGAPPDALLLRLLLRATSTRRPPAPAPPRQWRLAALDGEG